MEFSQGLLDFWGRTAWQFIQDLAGRLGKPLDMPDKGSQIGRANF